jgi:hypothetical protein
MIWSALIIDDSSVARLLLRRHSPETPRTPEMSEHHGQYGGQIDGHDHHGERVA